MSRINLQQEVDKIWFRWNRLDLASVEIEAIIEELRLNAAIKRRQEKDNS